jgi:hypothetical protein
MNAQIEMVLSEALRQAGRWKSNGSKNPDDRVDGSSSKTS